jgi:hypothetical protein
VVWDANVDDQMGCIITLIVERNDEKRGVCANIDIRTVKKLGPDNEFRARLALAIPSPGLSPTSCIRTSWAASASSVRLKKNYVKSHLIQMCRRLWWQLWLCPRPSSLRSFVHTITIKFVSHYGPWDCRTQIMDEKLSLLVLFALLLALLSITFIIRSNLLDRIEKLFLHRCVLLISQTKTLR